MNAHRQRLLMLSLLAVALALVVVLLGAWTRLSNAGLGCPDWPGCYGYLHVPESAVDQAAANARFPDSPVQAHLAWPEMVHRYFVGGLALLIVAIAALSWFAPRAARVPRGLPTALVGLVIAQALFGMLTVTWKLWPQVVTTHLLGGFATLSLLWLLALRLGWTRPAAANAAPRAGARGTSAAHGMSAGRGMRAAAVRVPSFGLGLFVLFVVIVQIKLGGWTAANYAGLACPDFPTCQGQWLPPLDLGKGFDIFQGIGPSYLGGLLDNGARVAIHVVHRCGAIAVLLAMLPLVIGLLRSGDLLLRQLSLALVAIVTLQVGLGIANVHFSLPLGVGVAHNGVAAVLLLTLVSVNYRLFLHRRISQ